MKRLTVFALAVFAMNGGSPARSETTELCGAKVDFKLGAIEQGAPADAKDVQGVWVGTWEGGMCSALVVESVSASGTLAAVYVFGRYQPWNIAQPGSQHWTGTITGNKLKFTGARGGVDYTFTGPGKLDGLYYNGGGQYKGTFSKR